MFAIIFSYLVTLLISSSAFAASDSGCGLGSLIIQKNSKILQLLSETTNSYLFTQPLGITFGTSGCSASGLVMNDKQVEYFVEVNQEDLSREMAQGKGEKLQTLSSLSGCKSEQAQSQFAKVTQQSYEQIFSSADVKPNEMVGNLKSTLTAHPELVQMCHGA